MDAGVAGNGNNVGLFRPDRVVDVPPSLDWLQDEVCGLEQMVDHFGIDSVAVFVADNLMRLRTMTDASGMEPATDLKARLQKLKQKGRDFNGRQT